jgi:ribosome recycling factor
MARRGHKHRLEEQTMATEVLASAETRMQKAVEVFKRDLAGIRTGRASPALVERLMVEYYGTPTPLSQLAAITVPEARLLVIQPWDPAALAAIEKAILKSDLNLTPTTDGRVIRLVLPPLTEERRKDLVRLVRKKAEEGRIAVRNIRRDALEDLKRLEKEKQISEDEFRRLQDRLQKLTDRYIEEVDKAATRKEEEILEV